MSAPSNNPLEEWIPNRIWLKTYPVHYAGLDFSARATVILFAEDDALLPLRARVPTRF